MNSNVPVSITRTGITQLTNSSFCAIPQFCSSFLSFFFLKERKEKKSVPLFCSSFVSFFFQKKEKKKNSGIAQKLFFVIFYTVKLGL